MIRAATLAAFLVIAASVSFAQMPEQGAKGAGGSSGASGSAGGGTSGSSAGATATPGSQPVPPVDPGERPSEGFHVDLSATAWFARVTGSTYGGGPAKYDLVSDLHLNTLEPSFFGDVEASWHAFHLRVSGGAFSVDGGNDSTASNVYGGVNVASGDPTTSSLDFWTFGGDLGVDIWRPFADQPFPFGERSYQAWNVNSEGGYKADLKLGAFVGVRALSTTQNFTDLRTAQSAVFDNTWTAVYVGGRVSIDIWLKDIFPLLRRTTIDGSFGFGPTYPGTGVYRSAQATVTIYPCETFGFQFGYRLMKFDGKRNGYEIEPNFAGLFVGGIFHF